VSIDSVMNEAVMTDLIAESDVVFHLAAAVGVKLIVEAPVRTIRNERAGHRDCAAAGRAAQQDDGDLLHLRGVRKEHGCAVQRRRGPCDGPDTETPVGVRCSKAIDEFLALAYYKEKGLPVIIVRLFNTVGPRQTGRYGMVIPNFVRQALVGEPITVHGDGRQTRSFTYVGDVVRGLIALMHEPRAVGQVVNIGNNEEISIMDLARRVKEATGSRSEIVLVPYDQAYEAGFEDMPRRVPDLARIAGLVGYAPTLDLDGILAKVIEDQRARLTAAHQR
jgi:UDP-glucose 4-epimerase